MMILASCIYNEDGLSDFCELIKNNNGIYYCGGDYKIVFMILLNSSPQISVSSSELKT